MAAPGNGSAPTFEVERFALSDEGRLEVSGRWFGVRGRRFIRPTLTLDGEGRRALAVLDHKPWSVADGARWTAAFPCPEDPAAIAGGAELAVAPDIAVALPGLVDANGNGNGKAPKRRARAASPARRGEHERAQLEATLAERDRELARSAERIAELEEIAAEQRAATAERDTLAATLSRTENERDALATTLSRTEQDRDALAAARDGERGAAAKALAEVDGLRQDLELTIAGRRVAEHARERAVAERADAIAQRDDLLRRWESASARANQAVAELEKLATAREAERARPSAPVRLVREPAVDPRAWLWRSVVGGTLALFVVALIATILAT